MKTPNPLGFKDPRDPMKNIRSVLSDNINIVFDIGANVGQTAKAFYKAFPNASIYSFEPVKNTFLELSSNTATLDRVKVFNMALSDKAGETQIFLANDSGHNSIEKNTDHGLGQETIKLNMVEQFCGENNIDSIDVLKIDAEGHEVSVLRGAENMLRQGKIKVITLEVGFYKSDIGHGNFCDIMLYLQKFNFQIFSIDTIQSAYIDGIQYQDHPWTDAIFVHNEIIQNLYGPYLEDWMKHYLEGGSKATKAEEGQTPGILHRIKRKLASFH